MCVVLPLLGCWCCLQTKPLIWSAISLWPEHILTDSTHIVYQHTHTKKNMGNGSRGSKRGVNMPSWRQHHADHRHNKKNQQFSDTKKQMVLTLISSLTAFRKCPNLKKLKCIISLMLFSQHKRNKYFLVFLNYSLATNPSQNIHKRCLLEMIKILLLQTWSQDQITRVPSCRGGNYFAILSLQGVI